MSEQTFSTLCPKCGRHVPNTVATCRCGQSMAGLHPPAVTPTVESDDPPAPTAVAAVVILSSAITLLVVFGAVLLMRGGPAQKPALPIPSAPAAAIIPASERAEPKPKPASLDPTPSAVLSLEELVSKTMPAVVRIETNGRLGSGFFTRPDTILTNEHVVKGSDSVVVRRPDRTTVVGRVQSTAPEFDIAVVHIDNARANQETIPLGSGDRARTGEEVVAFGSPLGLQNTVTRGIVSAVRRVGDVTLVQTDAAVNPGNSGGPLINRSGEAIGITTMTTRSAQGLSFAVAIDHARAVLAGKRSPGRTPLESLMAELSTRPDGPNREAASPANPQPWQTPQPPPALPAASPPTQPSTADRIREQGTQTYERAMTQLSQRADNFDLYWQRFRASCYGGSIAGSFDREWFAVLDPRAMTGSVAPGCASSFNDIQRTAQEIRSSVLAADESARQADVYPGIRRDVRRRFRLDLIR